MAGNGEARAFGFLQLFVETVAHASEKTLLGRVDRHPAVGIGRLLGADELDFDALATALRRPVAHDEHVGDLLELRLTDLIANLLLALVHMRSEARIGEAPIEVQVMLLRVLETGRVQPVGVRGMVIVRVKKPGFLGEAGLRAYFQCCSTHFASGGENEGT